MSAAQDHPDILPSSFKTDQFQRDMELFTVLTELSTLAESVMSQIDDTRLALGSEAMRQSTQIYEYVKTAAKTTPGLKPVADQLGERWKVSKQRESGEPTE
uniref:Phasin protein n=1 Tax=Candidatus Kentrum sp. FM TaxID=2126340 RepID=A0A450WNW5_9GAMM|nr:MAG: hypothetical protein BECKFM1743A_GA0114220_105486 [Candidatus Kentron sp. FM]VFJ70818.1 MAG: hypothetical protein BECKFM1743C_GA0114222_105736 [Candidatus Kentron sp. FM]VFK18737.1 MAG: hypothetical protein BECKFM1743B_GA0114221_105696 [Candidatus Kentron sp. FM]